MGRSLVHGLVVTVLMVCGATAATDIRQGPRVLKPAEHGVGRYVPDASFVDLAGKTHKLSDFADRAAVVLAMSSTSCPVSKKYLPTLVEMAKVLNPRGVQFIVVNPMSSDDAADMRAAAGQLGDAVIYVSDKQSALAAAIGAATTTDVVVLDPSRTVVYHGAVDDQYGLGYALDAPRQKYLGDALEALLAGRTLLVAATEAPGCALDLQPVTSGGNVTYYGQISRLLQMHCVECHRDGGVAPFSLETYDGVVDHAGMMRKVVDRRVMPPWFAVPAKGEDPSHWLNDRSLTESERTMLLGWIAAGKAKGDIADAPKPRTFPDGWLIGKPDAVFAFAKPVKVKATGTMPYQTVIVETNLTQDRWVRAIQVRPGELGVVHHVIVSLRTDAGDGKKRDPATDERQGYWGIYVPGNGVLAYPDGYAKKLPRGAKLKFQVHYTPNGKATEDTTSIGLVFAKEPPEHEVHVAGLVNAAFEIPPGDADYHDTASIRIPVDVQVLAFVPHMHLRGKAARYELITPAGTSTLLDIPHYDFNWQLLYRLAQPLTVHAGETLRFTAGFDNSPGNPANPDPTKAVRWGPQTYDEMLLGYVEYIIPGEKAGDTPDTMRRAALAGAVRESAGSAIFSRLDVNGDGFVTRDEVEQRLPGQAKALAVFELLDINHDGKLDKDELSRMQR